MAPLGPLGRLVVQVIVPVIAVVARALPAAYQAALQNARTSGAKAASSSGKSSRDALFGTKRLSHSEALQILNLQEATATPRAIQQQYEKYFAANAVEKGGSFYLQSKVHRAKELLDQYLQDEEEEEKNRRTNGSPEDSDERRDKKSSSSSSSSSSSTSNDETQSQHK